jgi:hypothetical protein
LCNHFIITLYGVTLRPRPPPSEWLTKWLATKGAGPVDSKYALMDLGGELGRYQEVLDLSNQAGHACYRIEGVNVKS